MIMREKDGKKVDEMNMLVQRKQGEISNRQKEIKKKQALMRSYSLFLLHTLEGLGEFKEVLKELKANYDPRDYVKKTLTRDDIRVLMPNWLWFVRLLREDGQLEEAQKALDAIFQRESGQQNLEAQREKLLLMELREDWVKVAEGWQKRLGELRALRGHFQTTLKTKQEALKRAPFDRQEEAQRDVENAERNLKKANELFFESYYHATYSFFKIGKT